MTYTNTEKKRLRRSFGKLSQVEDLPELLHTQIKAYKKFTQEHVKLGERDPGYGIEAVLLSVFPIVGNIGNSMLDYVEYRLDAPELDEQECLLRGVSYTAPLHVKLRLRIYDRDAGKQILRATESKYMHQLQMGLEATLSTLAVKELREEEVFFGSIPMMTKNGSFIINGTERVVVSQLHRSPGVFFCYEKSKTPASGRLPPVAHVIPYRGSWLDFEFDAKDIVNMRIDRRSKLPCTVMLYALEYTTEEILAEFYDNQTLKLNKDGSYDLEMDPERMEGETYPIEIVSAKKKMLVPANETIRKGHVVKMQKEKLRSLSVDAEYLMERCVSRDIVDTNTGEVLLSALQHLDEKKLIVLREAGIEEVPLVHIAAGSGPYILETLRSDSSTRDRKGAILRIARMIRPGEPEQDSKINQMFENLFFNETGYNLSKVGRMKLNRRLGRDDASGSKVLEKEDIVAIIKELVAIRDGKSDVDDIDHLGNRRVRSVGETVENELRKGLLRVKRVVKERLGQAEADQLTPRDLINPKPIMSAVMEFFGGSQLSQFMDQENPLSEVTHKRRISVLGPGGLSRERAGFEVRDVHPSHYGRVCPVETPEGQNIGLINSLATYAKINDYGFIETPYRKVEDGKVGNQVEYMSALDEREYVIAQASAPLDKEQRFVEQSVTVRHANEFTLMNRDSITYMDVSPLQVVSVAASLIPFLEHDDANRALMGSNMQRQALPTLRAEKPLVGTGMERYVARDSGVCAIAQRPGYVESVDAGRIVVRVDEASLAGDEDVGVDIYTLKKYRRSNQHTCVSQCPVVRRGDHVSPGDILADGASVDKGELALGQNVRIAFMPWNGYNFEDSILISERLVREDRFTSIHIHELVCIARETDLGVEEITADIPNVREATRNKLDGDGVVYIGAEVVEGDLLVGKLSPKGETQQTPEEKLLAAIFGEHAKDVKDTSLRVPSGMKGVVIDVQILTRSDMPADKKGTRACAIEEQELKDIEKYLDEESRIRHQDILSRLGKRLVGQKILRGAGLKKGHVLTKENIEKLSSSDLLDLHIADAEVHQMLEKAGRELKKLQNFLSERLEERRELQRHRGDALNPGVLKIVKVLLAVKRHVQPGDKMAGRHGNKGVISRIVPIEDMPYDEEGNPVDMVLNPLGVPSRMNVGQVLEVHLGLAAWGLGRKIDQMLREKKTVDELRGFLEQIYNQGSTKKVDFKNFQDAEITELANNLRDGVPMSTPVFDGAREKEIKSLLSLAGYQEHGQLVLYDGRTGERFERKVTVGYMYMMKLNHLVDDKMHARSTGSYSLVTQQPLGGKAQFGGQRFGEMEVWALEAYGASYTLQEMLTIKSDDISGRKKAYKNIVDGNFAIEVGVPESFKVLKQEILALGINMEVEQ